MPLTERMTVGICLSPTLAVVSTDISSYRTSMEGVAMPTLRREQRSGAGSRWERGRAIAPVCQNRTACALCSTVLDGAGMW